jgi:hypothetical protein
MSPQDARTAVQNLAVRATDEGPYGPGAPPSTVGSFFHTQGGRLSAHGQPPLVVLSGGACESRSDRTRDPHPRGATILSLSEGTVNDE